MVFLFFVLFYLKGRAAERDKEIFHPLVQSQISCNRHSETRSKPGARKPTHVSHVVAGTWEFRLLSTAFPNVFTGSRTGSGSTSTQTGSPMKDAGVTVLHIGPRLFWKVWSLKSCLKFNKSKVETSPTCGVWNVGFGLGCWWPPTMIGSQCFFPWSDHIDIRMDLSVFLFPGHGVTFLCLSPHSSTATPIRCQTPRITLAWTVNFQH